MQLLQYIARFTQSWKRDSTVVPAVCFAQCNNAYIEAQKYGKSSTLCAANSTFNIDYQSCQKCVAANGDASKNATQTFVSPEFQPVVDFCATQTPQSLWNATVITSQITSFSSLRTETTTATVYFTPSSLGTTPAIQQITGTNLPSPSNTPKASKKHAWIAGAVIGPIIALLFLVALFFFVQRRKKQKTQEARGVGGMKAKDDMEEKKAQLYGDSRVFHELPTGNYHDPMPEMPAREPVASELWGKDGRCDL